MPNLSKPANEKSRNCMKTLPKRKVKLLETFRNLRLKELLQQKLIECGWRDQVKAHCKGNKAFGLNSFRFVMVLYRHVDQLLANIK